MTTPQIIFGQQLAPEYCVSNQFTPSQVQMFHRAFGSGGNIIPSEKVVSYMEDLYVAAEYLVGNERMMNNAMGHCLRYLLAIKQGKENQWVQQELASVNIMLVKLNEMAKKAEGFVLTQIHAQ